MKPRWLDRRLGLAGPRLSLCLSEKEFRETIVPLKPPAIPKWIKALQADATVHYFDHDDGGLACVICLSGWEGRNPVEVSGLLIHEAVHVWQAHCEHIGEHTPGTEQEAYAIQAISQELLAEFSRRMNQ